MDPGEIWRPDANFKSERRERSCDTVEAPGLGAFRILGGIDGGQDGEEDGEGEREDTKPAAKRGSLNRLPMVRSLIEKCAAEMESEKPTKSLVSEFVRLLALEKELAVRERDSTGDQGHMGRTNRDGIVEIGIEYAALPSQQEIPCLEGKIQGIFGTDRIGEEPGAVPWKRSGLTYLESRATGADRRADLPDVAGCNAADAVRYSGREPAAVRLQQGRELDADEGYAVEDPVPVAGRFRAAAGDEPGVVRGG